MVKKQLHKKQNLNKTRKTPNGIMHRFFKKVDQKVNLGWLQIPDTRPNIAILKDGFF